MPGHGQVHASGVPMQLKAWRLLLTQYIKNTDDWGVSKQKCLCTTAPGHNDRVFLCPGSTTLPLNGKEVKMKRLKTLLNKKNVLPFRRRLKRKSKRANAQVPANRDVQHPAEFLLRWNP